MAVASAFAALFAFAQHKLALLPSGFNINETVLRSLATVNDETIAVAFVAGIAAMLAFETRASSGVGVAISVTTIPAAAYLGVAAGLGEATKALGALAVLATNVVMIVAGAAITLGSATPHGAVPQPPIEQVNDPRWRRTERPDFPRPKSRRLLIAGRGDACSASRRSPDRSRRRSRRPCFAAAMRVSDVSLLMLLGQRACVAVAPAP